MFTLGSVYLQLLKLFRLEEHPSFTRPIDPSLYIHRFTGEPPLAQQECMMLRCYYAWHAVTSPG